MKNVSLTLNIWYGLALTRKNICISRQKFDYVQNQKVTRSTDKFEIGNPVHVKDNLHPPRTPFGNTNFI